MNTLAIFKALGKAKKIFANIVPKPSPNSVYTRTGGNTFPPKKGVINELLPSKSDTILSL